MIPYEWLIPAIGLIIWVVLVLVIVPPLLRHLQRRSEQTQKIFRDIVISALRIPVLFLLISLGVRLFIDVTPMPEKWVKYTHAVVIVLFVLAVYLFLDRLMVAVLRHYKARVPILDSSAGVIKTLYRCVTLAFVFLIIMDLLKITITPFLASLGIGGLVVALALQETLSNFFSGIYLYFDKPIRIGDYVRLESGEEGYVTHIGWHSTRIKMLSNNTLIISNAKLAQSRITNMYIPDSPMAVLVQVGVGYQSDLKKVEQVTVDVAREVLQTVEGGVKEFAPFIRYNAFADHSINFTVILQAKEYTDQYLIVHEFIKRLHDRYRLEGIEIPYPVRTVYMRNEVR